MGRRGGGEERNNGLKGEGRFNSTIDAWDVT